MDETKTNQDASERDSSGNAGGSTSDQTYTESEVRKQVSDALAAAGRNAKALSERQERVAADEKRVAALSLEVQRQKEETEIEAARGDPDELTRIRRTQSLRQKEQTIEQRDTALRAREEATAEREKKIQEQLSQLSATTIAGKYEGVSVEDLLAYTDGSPEKMETLAQKLSGKGAAPRPKMKLDSGATMGGGKGLTVETVRGMSAEDIVRHAKEIAKLPLTI